MSADPREIAARLGADVPCRWGKVPLDVATSGLTRSALELFIALSCHAEAQSRFAWPSQATLARELGWVYSRKTGEPGRRRIREALGELEAADLIRRAGQHVVGPRGRWTRQWAVAPFPTDGTDRTPSAVTDGTVRAPSAGRPMAQLSSADGRSPGSPMAALDGHEQTEQTKDLEQSDPPWVQKGISWEAYAQALAAASDAGGEA